MVSSFSSSRRIGAAKTHEIHVNTGFTHGYRSREDVTILPAGTLVVGSHDVLTDVSGRVGARKGYTMDGAKSSVVAPILTSIDWPTHFNATRHLRAGFLTSAGNDGKLQVRYQNATTSAVTWFDLLTGLSSTTFNSCDYWDTTNLQSLLLMVNGQSLIYDWSGLMTTIASATAATITKTGTTTWAQEGAYLNGTRSVIINGTTYAYTGGESTTTLTGVTPSPAAEPANSVAYQSVRTNQNSAMTSIPATFKNSLIANLRNQIYVGSLVDSSVYVSKINNFLNYAFTAGGRLVGEGALVTMDGTPTAFIPQEDYMTLFAGKDQIYQTKFTLSSDLTKESFEVSRLKTTSLQGSLSQKATTKIKNDILYLSFETILNTLGRVDNVVLTPQVTDISYPIVNDFNSYDFTDSQVFYNRQYAYISVPKQSLVLIYNMTNPKNPYWEAPLTLPISCFSAIDGKVYGHSYQLSESYQLFNGYSDRAVDLTVNGNEISASAVFAFENGGVRNKSKSFNKLFAEGYISSSTILNAGIQYDMDGCATSTSIAISGNDNTIVCIGTTDDNSLGKFSFGKVPFGGNMTMTSPNALPPRFNVIKTFGRTPFYNWQPSFSSYGVSQNWQLLGFGVNIGPTSEGDAPITQ